MGKKRIKGPICPLCGCHEHDACKMHGVPCCWVDDLNGDLVCSACCETAALVATPMGREWLELVMASARTGKHPPYEPCQAFEEPLPQEGR